jgi:hypothetical protein
LVSEVLLAEEERGNIIQFYNRKYLPFALQQLKQREHKISSQRQSVPARKDQEKEGWDEGRRLSKQRETVGG